MKYNQSSKFPRFVGSTGFYVVIACCLIAVGAAAWFAVSRYNEATETPSVSSTPSASSRSRDTSSGITSSSDKDVIPVPSQRDPAVASSNVANPVSDVPYESEDSGSTAPIAKSFVIPVDGNISKGYSATALQYSATYGDMRLHTGIDIVCEKGTDVKAAGMGKVTQVEESPSLGRMITVDHGNSVIVKYCGLDSVNVAVGDNVSAGDPLGASGSVPCECADQSHIHIEATKDGKAVSPLEALGLQ